MSVDSGSEVGNAGSGVPGSGTAAEAKRVAARRRFLLGGATALPLIVTLGQREAWAASAAVCASLGLDYDAAYVEAEKLKGGLEASLYCNPNSSW